jgi:hypothetical protein
MEESYNDVELVIEPCVSKDGIIFRIIDTIFI